MTGKTDLIKKPEEPAPSRRRAAPSSNRNDATTHRIAGSNLATQGAVQANTRDDAARIASIDVQLDSLVITDTYRAELEQKRAELQLVAGLREDAAARVDLIALRQEAQARESGAALGLSVATSGPGRIQVPLRTLFAVPDPHNEYALYYQIAADPSSESVPALASAYSVDQYLSGKLDWPVTIELVEPGEGIWFMFSIQGQALLVSRKPELPLSALDAVSPESLHEVSKRATLIVEAASFEAAFDEVTKTIADKAAAMIAAPEDYARNEAVGLSQLTNSFVKRLDDLAGACGSRQGWIKAKLTARRNAMLPLIERVKEMGHVTNNYHNEVQADMPTYSGETYDRLVAESENFVERGAWKILRGIGDVVTGGGQSTQAENARMYRAGEISRSDYKKNWVLNIVRVGATAAITALTAGRATGPALRMLGLESGTAAAAVTAGTAEGAVGGFTQAFSSDVFAKAVALSSSSAGVVGFHERTIGGLDAWLAGAGWGGAFGAMFGAGGHFWERYRATTPSLPESGQRSGALSDHPEVIGLKIKDEPNGDFTLLIEDPVSGKRLVVQGNRLTGDARVVDPATGELVGSMRGGAIETPVYGPQQLSTTSRALPGAVETPLSRASEIEGWIASESRLCDPVASWESLDPNQFSVAGARPPASTLAEVDLSDLSLEREAQYTTRFPSYIDDTLARGRLPRLGNLRDYIRFRHGIDSGQLVRGYSRSLSSGNPSGMSIEARVAINAGRSAETLQGILRTSNKNNRLYELARFFDPIRQKWVQKRVIPDFMPTARRDAGGRFVNAQSPADAVVIADSKYTWDAASTVQLDDQVAAMMILARDNQKPFVFLLGEGRDVSASVRAFAQAEGVEIYIAPDTSGLIR